jgi:hypothetical protein
MDGGFTAAITQPASLSKDGRFFVQTTGSTSRGSYSRSPEKRWVVNHGDGQLQLLKLVDEMEIKWGKVGFMCRWALNEPPEEPDAFAPLKCG